MSPLQTDYACLADEQQESWQRQRRYVGEHSDFYRELWQGAEAPEKLADLAQLPLSAKHQLREAQAAMPPFGTSCEGALRPSPTIFSLISHPTNGPLCQKSAL